MEQHTTAESITYYLAYSRTDLYAGPVTKSVAGKLVHDL